MSRKSEDRAKFDKLSEFEFRREVLRQLEELQRQIAHLGDDHDDEVDLRFPMEVRLPSGGSKGRRAKLPLDEHLWRRDWFIEKFERHCPEIIERLLDAKNADATMRALLIPEIADSPVKPGFLQAPDLCAEQVHNFLRSGRFHDNPRNLANAVAGLPELSWKRSFDVCTANPPSASLAMHPRAYRNFLKRGFPQRLRELDDALTTEDVSRILAKSRSKDPTYLTLRAAPHGVLGWLREGKDNRDE